MKTEFTNLELCDPIDGFEWHPCKVNDKGTDREHVEQCDAEEAEFFGVYAHYAGGGLDCLCDVETEEEAENMVKVLTSIGKNYFGKVTIPSRLRVWQNVESDKVITWLSKGFTDNERHLVVSGDSPAESNDLFVKALNEGLRKGSFVLFKD